MRLAVMVVLSLLMAVSAAAQADEDLKLLALRGLMRSDPERTLPMVEQVLGGNSSVRVKENALFVLSQSRSPRAWEIISGIAKGSTNPDLQLKAIRYIGTMGGPDRLQTLADIYRGSTDTAVSAPGCAGPGLPWREQLVSLGVIRLPVEQSLTKPSGHRNAHCVADETPPNPRASDDVDCRQSPVGVEAL